jgi:predicted transcriptional regulator of viral defense system
MLAVMTEHSSAADAPHSARRAALSVERLRQVGAGAFFRARDAAAFGLRSADLRRLAEQELIERVARGLYRLTDAEPTEHYTIAAVSARVPGAIVCLLSALRVHGIGTQLPREVWIAVPHKARAPRLREFPVKVVRFSGGALSHGVETVRLEGMPVRITNVARTVVDCFRFRRLVGAGAARQALRAALREGKATPAQIWRAAEACRARSLLAPVLEVLAE